MKFLYQVCVTITQSLLSRIPVQALPVLSNAIEQAWYKHEVAALLSFYLKGAFNWVDLVKSGCLVTDKKDPDGCKEMDRANFMGDRHANIGFGDFRTETDPLANRPGARITTLIHHVHSSTLIWWSSPPTGDYFRWRMGPGPSAEDIPRIKEWARQTRSCFTADKTKPIHLTGKKGERSVACRVC